MEEVLGSLLDVRGRLSRGGFWLLYFGALAFALLTLPFQVLLLRRPELSLLIWSPAFVVLFLGMIRRLHDRGRSGWSLVPVYGAWLLFVLLVFGFRASPGEGPLGYLAVATMVVMFGGGSWLLLEILGLPGMPGPNGFGPDPLQSEGGGALRRALALLGQR